MKRSVSVNNGSFCMPGTGSCEQPGRYGRLGSKISNNEDIGTTAGLDGERREQRKRQKRSLSPGDDWDVATLEMPSSPAEFCRANVLVVRGDRGWREKGVIVEKRTDREQGNILAVVLRGEILYSIKPEHRTAYAASSRNTQNLIWKGEKGWSLEFNDKKEWNKFREMTEECYHRNSKAASMKRIPVPGVRELPDDDTAKNLKLGFLRPPYRYIRTPDGETQLALPDCTRIVYDMDTDDEEWLAKVEQRRISGELLLSLPISEDLFEKLMDRLEKDSHILNGPVMHDMALKLLEGVAPEDVITTVYGHWFERRLKKGMALIRHFQPPPWEQYQNVQAAWQAKIQQMMQQQPGLSRQQLQQQHKRPPIFAFCLRPRGMQQEKFQRQRSHKKLDRTGQSVGPADHSAILISPGSRRKESGEAGEVWTKAVSDFPNPAVPWTVRRRSKLGSQTGTRKRNDQSRRKSQNGRPQSTVMDLAGAFKAAAQRQQRSRPSATFLEKVYKNSAIISGNPGMVQQESPSPLPLGSPVQSSLGIVPLERAARQASARKARRAAMGERRLRNGSTLVRPNLVQPVQNPVEEENKLTKPMVVQPVHNLMEEAPLPLSQEEEPLVVKDRPPLAEAGEDLGQEDVVFAVPVPEVDQVEAVHVEKSEDKPPVIQTVAEGQAPSEQEILPVIRSLSPVLGSVSPVLQKILPEKLPDTEESLQHMGEVSPGKSNVQLDTDPQVLSPKSPHVLPLTETVEAVAESILPTTPTVSPEEMHPPLELSSLVPETSSKLPEGPSVVLEKPGGLLEEPSIPSENPSVPSENPSIPSENPSVPSENPSVPSENPSVPSEILSVPCENLSVPSETLIVLPDIGQIPSEKLNVSLESDSKPSLQPVESFKKPLSVSPVSPVFPILPDLPPIVAVEEAHGALTDATQSSVDPKSNQLPLKPPVKKRESRGKPKKKINKREQRVRLQAAAAASRVKRKQRQLEQQRELELLQQQLGLGAPDMVGELDLIGEESPDVSATMSGKLEEEQFKSLSQAETGKDEEMAKAQVKEEDGSVNANSPPVVAVYQRRSESKRRAGKWEVVSGLAPLRERLQCLMEKQKTAVKTTELALVVIRGETPVQGGDQPLESNRRSTARKQQLVEKKFETNPETKRVREEAQRKRATANKLAKAAEAALDRAITAVSKAEAIEQGEKGNVQGESESQPSNRMKQQSQRQVPKGRQKAGGLGISKESRLVIKRKSRAKKRKKMKSRKAGKDLKRGPSSSTGLEALHSNGGITELGGSCSQNIITGMESPLEGQVLPFVQSSFALELLR